MLAEKIHLKRDAVDRLKKGFSLERDKENNPKIWVDETGTDICFPILDLPNI